jgi:hypothetical protein
MSHFSRLISRVGIFLMRRAIRTALVFPTINLSGRGDAAGIRCVLIHRRAPLQEGNAGVLVDMTDHLFEAEFVSAGLARVFNPFAADLIKTSARPDVLVPTRWTLARWTLDGPQPGRCSKIAPRGVPRQPRRCSKTSHLSDSGEAFPHSPWFGYGPEESLPLFSTPYQPGLIARISDWCSLM